MRYPCGIGMHLREYTECSDTSTNKTLSGMVAPLNFEANADPRKGPIDVESHCTSDDLFYRNNYPDTIEKVSSVHTDELEDLSLLRLNEKQFIKDVAESPTLNQRTFNVNEVLGNFPVDRFGQIINRDEILRKRKYRDFDDQPVNECGYLINELTGAIRSRYTHEDLLQGEVNVIGQIGELPMPYRLEKHNFNPQRIMGAFDLYQDQQGNQIPIRLTNKFGVHTDKFYRPVNMSGYLVNERGDIIDNREHVRFKKEQLRSNGGIPFLYNYKGEKFKITDIIGTFERDEKSKEIILQIDPITGKKVDLYGRQANGSGYLVDNAGNIVKYVQDKPQIVFQFWELLFMEPPKMFEFTEFDIRWVKGTLRKGWF